MAKKSWNKTMLEVNRLRWSENKTNDEIGSVLKIPVTQVIRLVRPMPDYLRQIS
jgi:DNA-directed RNA polymerase specialized sigma subunit